MNDAQQIETLLWALGTVIFIGVGSYSIAQLARLIAGLFKLSLKEQKQVFWGFFFASPWLLGYLIFVLGPSAASLYFSFTEYKLGTAPEWIGVENFRELILAEGRDGRNFKAAMYNSLYYTIIGVPLQIGAALIMAMLLDTSLRGMKGFRLIYYLPVILAGSPALLLAWRYMLSANGGFVNEALGGFAGVFAPFDWLYRTFIYTTESFNGFFIGVAKGDPTGPFAYFMAAFVGVVVVFNLLRGDWNIDKHTFAQRTAEVIGVGGGLFLLARGLMQTPVAPYWIYVLTAIVIGVCAISGRLVRVIALLAGFGIVAFALVVVMGMSFEDVPYTRGSYVFAILASVVVMAVTAVMVGRGMASPLRVNMVYAVLAGLMGIGALVHIVPGQIAGKTGLLWDYLTLRSALTNPADIDYLSDVFPVEYFSAVWLVALVIVVCVAVLLIGARAPRARTALLAISVAFFGLIAVSAFVDGVRYFNAYENVSAAAERPNYHFARFHEASGTFPGANHQPKWLSSDLWVKPSLILIQMWSAGTGMLVFLAALKGVPKSLYESAKVDGANRFDRFFKITLPIISPAMFYNVVLGMIAALQTFEPVYILRTTETETSVMSAAFYLYRRTFEQANIGEGAAMSWVLAIIIVAITAAQFRYSNWVNYEV
ncbi:MAG: sugar ABC transporter permease [Chloroflexota bacterium]